MPIYKYVVAACLRPQISPYYAYLKGDTDLRKKTYAIIYEQIPTLDTVPVYFNFKYDRRGRFHCMQHPINYQHHTVCRGLLSDCVDSQNVLFSAISYVMSNNLWGQLDYITLPNMLLNHFNSICFNPLYFTSPLYAKDDILRYLRVLYVNLCIKFIYSFSKPSLHMNDESTICMHTNLLYAVLTSDLLHPDSAIYIIKKYNLNVPEKEFTLFMSLLMSIGNFVSGTLDNGVQFLDASGSVFQIHVLSNAISDPLCYHMCGLVPDVSFMQSNVYQHIMEQLHILIKKSELSHQLDNISPLITRDLVKSISMPRLYGMRRLGSDTAVYKLYSKVFLHNLIGENSTKIFVKFL